MIAAPIAWPTLAARQVTAVSLVVRNGIIITVDGNRRILNPGSIAINGTDIVAIDTPANIAARYQAADTIDATGKVVMPGLINTHTHAAMVMYRGLGNDLALMDWLQKYIFPAEAKTVSPEFVRVGTRLALLEMIQSGTTLYADMYYFEEEVARVTKAAGLRGVLGQTVIEFPVPDAKTPADALKRTEAFAKEFANDELITPSMAPHAVYTLDAEDADGGERAGQAIEHPDPDSPRRDIGGDGHVAGASQDAAGRDSRQPEVLGAGDHRARTRVWINADEIALLKQRNVGVSNNPESNMKLSSGTAPVMGYRKAGVNVGIGTDGAASNNDLDMFEAMRQAAFQQKLITMDPTAHQRARGARDGHHRRRARRRSAGQDWIARTRQARRPDRRRAIEGEASAAVRSRCADRLRVARRRCGDDHRQRQGADARSEGADAGRSARAGRRARSGGPGAEGGSVDRCRIRV